MRALIIDDSRSMRMILGKALNELGIETIQAANGRLGLEALHDTAHVDLVMVDWHMPEMDGYEFVCAARAEPALAAIPIVMVTSEAETDLIQKALEAGATEFLMKPFTADAVRMKLEMIGIELGSAP
jgi:two-component system chemotaxis response regulator CheY